MKYTRYRSDYTYKIIGKPILITFKPINVINEIIIN